jgi:type IV secretion system protein VirB10
MAGVVLAIAMTGLLGSKHKRPDTTGAHNFSGGIPYSQPVEAKPAVAKAMPHIDKPAVAKQLTNLAPSKDTALEAPIFATSGQGYSGRTDASRAGGAGGGNGEKDDEFTSAMTASSVGAAAKAHRMKHPSLTIPAGVVIPCSLQTAINSELLGFVDCQLASAVSSADGAVTLMDKGTQVMGQIRSGLRRGQERLFILWVRARTPENVTVNLASPAADELGRSGVPGAVNNHFAKMFWTAAAYSLIQYGPQMATQAIANQGHNGSNNSFSNFGTFLTPQQQLANTVLQEDLKIPPTLEKNQGDIVSIFVARDLDFSGVFDLQMAGHSTGTCNDCPLATWTTERDLRRNR